METEKESKKNHKNNKWMKGLSKQLVKKILELNPVCVTYEVERPYRVICKIIDKEGNIGKGLAICSVIDEFDEKEGKNKVHRGRKKSSHKGQLCAENCNILVSRCPR